MVNGITEYKCDKCGNHFLAPDTEFHGSALSVPMPCPQCGSWHCYPNRFGIGWLNRRSYVKIWKKLNEEHKTDANK